MKNLLKILRVCFILLFPIIAFASCSGAPIIKQDISICEHISPAPEPVRETVPVATNAPKSYHEIKAVEKAAEIEPIPHVSDSPPPSPTESKATLPPDLPDYTIRLVNSSSLLDGDELPWVKDLSFNIVQVEGLKDKVLQDKINKTILEAMTHWIEDADPVIEEDIILLIPRTDATPTIYLQTNAYLSMSNHFDLYNPKRGDAIIDVITIDMKTGERVRLDDLFDINIAFAERVISLTEGMSIIWPTTTEPTDLLKELQNASLNNLEIRVGYPHRIGAMMHRTSFHLRENELIISFHREGALLLEELRSITIGIDDYEEFLLVEKW